MAAPATPNNVYVQQANDQVLISWDLAAGATSYPVLRSDDNITFAQVSNSSAISFLDDTVVSGTTYYYQVKASNGSGDSPASSVQSITPVPSGEMTLGQLRLLSQQKADRVNSNFVTLPEWNTYINQSYFELYDLLVTCYEDYFLAPEYVFATDGSDTYVLPPDFYKLQGVDLSIGNANNARVTLKKFDFIQRNRYIYPNITANFLGVFNLRYRLMGNRLRFIPTPSAGQRITVWYIPRLTMLLQDSDIADGISGWTEYIAVDAAIKALQKEESDVTVLMAEKAMLKQRIEESAMNRDAGQPDTISPTRRGEGGGFGFGPDGDGSFGGY